jgi:hypothetical protein
MVGCVSVYNGTLWHLHSSVGSTGQVKRRSWQHSALQTPTLPLLFCVARCRSQHEGLQNQLSSLRAELRSALQAVNGVRQTGLPPLSQAAQALAAGVSAGLSGLSAAELEVDRLAYMLRSSGQQVRKQLGLAALLVATDVGS